MASGASVTVTPEWGRECGWVLRGAAGHKGVQKVHEGIGRGC